MSPAKSFTQRKKARRFALQALYGWQLSGNDLQDVKTNALEEHTDKQYEKEYLLELIEQVPAHLGEIEEAFKPYLDRPIEDLEPIELNIIRIATYELKYKLDIPYRVVINEAVDIAKGYGSTDGHKYVNGVLDKMITDLRPNES